MPSWLVAPELHSTTDGLCMVTAVQLAAEKYLTTVQPKAIMPFNVTTCYANFTALVLNYSTVPAQVISL
jgi:hypothetical protein